MSRNMYRTNIEGIKQSIGRGFLVGCFSIMFATSVIIVHETLPVAASALAATSVRQDRRPDRERPVTTSQSSSSSYSSGSQVRPRLVRR